MEDKLLEKIDYDLCIYGDVTAESQKHRFMIIKTLAKIPEDTREKVLERTIFIIACKGVFGYPFDMRIIEPQTLHLILLNFGELEGKPEPVILSTIAHETAHSLLGHGHLSGNSKAEIEADDLIEKWGFERAYKDYSTFREFERKSLVCISD